MNQCRLARPLQCEASPTATRRKWRRLSWAACGSHILVAHTKRLAAGTSRAWGQKWSLARRRFRGLECSVTCRRRSRGRRSRSRGVCLQPGARRRSCLRAQRRARTGSTGKTRRVPPRRTPVACGSPHGARCPPAPPLKDSTRPVRAKPSPPPCAGASAQTGKHRGTEAASARHVSSTHLLSGGGS